MSITISQLIPFVGTTITIAGIVFKGGQLSEKLEIVGLKVEAQEKKEEYYNQSISQLLGKMDVLKNDVGNIKGDIKDIKEYIKNSKFR